MVDKRTALIAINLMAALLIRQASGCCCVNPKGRAVIFGDQTNIVIWNAETHTEHFVRNAKFRSDADDFGFIAPSPTKPDLAAVSSFAFATLAALKPEPTMAVGAKALDGAAAMEPKVDVVQEKDVAGYHATTLLANDAAALAAWMNQNGYHSTPGIETWTKPYIAKGWYLTAFKVKNPSDTASTGTVRMTFKTEKPFNPFYVPADNIQPGQKGVLKVYFVSDGDYTASIGSSEPWQESMWQADVPSDSVLSLAAQLKLSPKDIPPGAQVEAFQDNDFPRAASDDIYFTHHWSPSRESVAGVVIVAVAGLLLLKRRFRPASPAP